MNDYGVMFGTMLHATSTTHFKLWKKKVWHHEFIIFRDLYLINRPYISAYSDGPKCFASVWNVISYTPVSQTRWDPHPTDKIFGLDFAVPTGFFWIENNENKYPSVIKLKEFSTSTGKFFLNLSPLAMKLPSGQRQECTHH